MRLSIVGLAIALPLFGQGWWVKEPVRWVQVNLRETDAALDAKRLLDELAGFRANVLHFGMGGIAAYYPTKTPFHYPSPHLPAGRDMFGEVLAEAHKRGVRVVGRFDLSKTRKEVFDAHPEWFFRKSDGEPVIYNGLYSTCINGGYYRDQGMKILTEALKRYEIDGLFFNMFGNQSTDYSGRFVGHCHCDACKRKFRSMYSTDLPKEPDDQYREFMFRSSREVAAAIGDLIHAKRPHAGYFNYIQESTDGIMSESNTAVNRPLPLWPYTSSDNVNRALNSEPAKLPVNLNMQFVDYAWRFATVPQQEIALRLWQNVAHGGAAAFAINGTPMDLQDRQAAETAKPIFRWLAEHERLYAGQKSTARVLLLGGRSNQRSYRGMFRLLTEEHIPFVVADNLKWLEVGRQFDLVVATDWAPAELAGYVSRGGRVLIASPRKPALDTPPIVKTWPEVQGYLRVRDAAAFPSLSLTKVLMLNGGFTEVEASGSPSLTLVPPSMIGPPEKIHIDQVDTNIPGLVPLLKGRAIWLPWDLGTLYYRHSLPAHAGLFRDLISDLLPQRQLTTNAHPLVEVSMMRQGERTLLHLVNLSGHSDTAYFAPVRMTGIRVAVEGRFREARAERSGKSLPVKTSGTRTEVVIPHLEDYEVVVLEP